MERIGTPEQIQKYKELIVEFGNDGSLKPLSEVNPGHNSDLEIFVFNKKGELKSALFGPVVVEHDYEKDKTLVQPPFKKSPMWLPGQTPVVEHPKLEIELDYDLDAIALDPESYTPIQHLPKNLKQLSDSH